MDYNCWINKAIKKTSELTTGREFLLKDLFDGVEWNAIPKGNRMGFGRVFKNEVLEGNIPNIIYIGKEKNNSAKYRKEEQ